MHEETNTIILSSYANIGKSGIFVILAGINSPCQSCHILLTPGKNGLKLTKSGRNKQINKIISKNLGKMGGNLGEHPEIMHIIAAASLCTL